MVARTCTMRMARLHTMWMTQTHGGVVGHDSLAPRDNTSYHGDLKVSDETG
ncbi:Hypothetical predicted protein [Prunus dulcis]|uniref:Uncharacterized protein n=1 Tax=Prunus dulcis TaxID=3755 RepID=A0A5E4F7P7_PRUDU|nr:Hypothetical predicted protein [Prunus dulcis]